MSDKIRKIAKRLIDSQLAQMHEICGCTEAQIDSLEEDLKLQFPPIYRDFLLRMGRGAGKLFRGSDFTYGYLHNLKEWAIELLTESPTSFKLPENAHVFHMHQGYVFFYFIANGADDPDVFRFTEGSREPILTYDSFSLFLNDAVDGALYMKNESQAFRKKHGLKER